MPEEDKEVEPYEIFQDGPDVPVVPSKETIPQRIRAVLNKYVGPGRKPHEA